MCTISVANNNLLRGGLAHHRGQVQTDDANYGAATSPSFIQSVARATPTESITSTLNPSVQGQTVTFKVALTGVSGGAIPSGSVMFMSNGAPQLRIALVWLSTRPASPSAARNKSPPEWTPLWASTAAMSNYNTGVAPSLTQTVQDFSIAPTANMPVNITQGFSNSTDPYNQSSITVTVTQLYGFSAALQLACIVQPTKPEHAECPNVRPQSYQSDGRRRQYER